MPTEGRAIDRLVKGPSKTPRPVRLVIDCDWRDGISNPIQATKRLLKDLKRIFRVTVTAVAVEEATNEQPAA